MKIIIDEKLHGCDVAFWKVADIHNSSYPSKEWKQAKLDSCVELKYAKKHIGRTSGKTIITPKIPNTKNACVKLAKAMEAKGHKTNVLCNWGFYCNAFAV